jgi:hypothetical protein
VAGGFVFLPTHVFGKQIRQIRLILGALYVNYDLFTVVSKIFTSA